MLPSVQWYWVRSITWLDAPWTVTIVLCVMLTMQLAMLILECYYNCTVINLLLLWTIALFLCHVYLKQWLLLYYDNMLCKIHWIYNLMFWVHFSTFVYCRDLFNYSKACIFIQACIAITEKSTIGNIRVGGFLQLKQSALYINGHNAWRGMNRVCFYCIDCVSLSPPGLAM